jgi:hypothetical protein
MYKFRVLILFIIFSILPIVSSHVIAQDDEACSVESLKDNITNILDESYEESSELFDAIHILESEFNSDCSDAEDGIVDPTIATEGIWFIEWGVSINSCDDGSGSTSSLDRYIFVGFDEDQFVLQDAWVWTSLEFDFNDSEEFMARRLYPDGSRFEYLITDIQSDEIKGVSSLITATTCILSSEFVVSLYDESSQCVIGTTNGVNIRSKPSALSISPGRIDPDGGGLIVQGKAEGDDNFLWWKISDDQWVRSDIVVAMGNCNSVKTVEFD